MKEVYLLVPLLLTSNPIVAPSLPSNPMSRSTLSCRLTNFKSIKYRRISTQWNFSKTVAPS